MPADYLSRLPGAKETVASISAFDPFQADLYDLQMQDEVLQGIQTFQNTNQWPQTIPKQDHAYFTTMINKLFQDKNKVVWVRLSDFNYPRMALYLPSRYRKEAMCEAHNSIVGGHNATHKTYLKISTSYFWPKMRQDIEHHHSFCLRWQQRKKSTNKRTPLAPLPIPDHPNLQIHANHFGPMLTADSNKNSSFAFSSSTLWSLRLPTRRLKRWPTPFKEIGLQNSESRRRYTLTEPRSLSINCRQNYFNCWMSDIQKHRQRIPSAMPKWKCLTKQWKIFCNLLWTTQL